MCYKKIESCRICGNTNLIEVLSLGKQALTGIFPKEKDQDVSIVPLTIVKCHGEVDEVCHLLQLENTYSLEQMYGDNYGYRSGLNSSMVNHLKSNVTKILNMITVEPGDLVLDIGSNDGTTLNHYPKESEAILVGVDPTAKKFSRFYQNNVMYISDFFSEKIIREEFGDKKAKIITSFSMFYDLDNPIDFTRQIANVLQDDGLWVCEQSYMPEMLRQVSYDTVCHEHLEYYGLRQIHWITEKVGLKIIDVFFDDTNGGSFSVICAKKGSQFSVNRKRVFGVLEWELSAGLCELSVYEKFSIDVQLAREALIARLKEIKKNKKVVFGLGASTKGNVILQACGITEDLLPQIGEVNDEKYDCYTPGTHIPIHSEEEILTKKPDFLLVLPWHFKRFFERSNRFKDIVLLYPI